MRRTIMNESDPELSLAIRNSLNRLKLAEYHVTCSTAWST